jgi:hypothetical protein
VRRCVEEDEPELAAIPEGFAGPEESDMVGLSRRLLRAHQAIVHALSDPTARTRMARHAEWGRVPAGHLAAYQARHSHEHISQLASAFPPSPG